MRGHVNCLAGIVGVALLLALSVGYPRASLAEGWAEKVLDWLAPISIVDGVYEVDTAGTAFEFRPTKEIIISLSVEVLSGAPANIDLVIGTPSSHKAKDGTWQSVFREKSARRVNKTVSVGPGDYFLGVGAAGEPGSKSEVKISLKATPREDRRDTGPQSPRSRATGATDRVRILTAAAEAGDPKAEAKLAAMYLTGEGVTKDEAEGVRLFRRAAEHGDALSQHSLGTFHLGGFFGVAKDEGEAVRCFRRAAKQGYADSQKWLTDNNLDW